LSNLKIALIQGAIVLTPTYSIAFLTGKMIWTIPMLVASGFIAASFKNDIAEKKIDDDREDHDIEDG
jgi:hypothetical protein